MSRQSRLVTGFLSYAAIVTIGTTGASSQSAWDTNKIVACQGDADAHTLLLTTARRAALPAPTISYLPADDGETIMVADFPGLVWNLPTRIFRPSLTASSLHGIQEVRVGRFQESPPICRISITSDTPRAFKTVSFKALPGSLAINWGSSHNREKQIARTAEIPVSVLKEPLLPVQRPLPEAIVTQSWSSSNPSNNYSAKTPMPTLVASAALRPPITPEKISEKMALMPPVAPSLRTTHRANSELIGTIAPTKTPALDSSADAIVNDQDLERQRELEQERAQDLERPIQVSVDFHPLRKDNGPEALKLTVKATHPISYNTFRLHTPERYVIDFSNCPEIINATLPDVSQNTFVRSLRVGQPDDDKKTRLVLDLTDTPISVKEEAGEGASKLGLTLLGGDQIDIKAATAAPPIIPMPLNFSHLSMPPGTIIVLDAGHGGSDPGAQRGDVQEKEITLDIIAKLKRVLEAKGAQIVMTRSDDTFVSLEDRVRITNNTAPTLFLSVHINAMESASDIHGIETYYQTEQSRLLADAVHECLISGLAAPDRSVRKARFYVIRNTPVPAILAEVGFISNSAERDKLISSDYQMKIAEALEHGVILYLDRRLALQKSGAYTKSNENLPSANVTTNAATSAAGTNQSGIKSINQRIAQTKHRSDNDDLR